MALATPSGFTARPTVGCHSQCGHRERCAMSRMSYQPSNTRPNRCYATVPRPFHRHEAGAPKCSTRRRAMISSIVSSALCVRCGRGVGSFSGMSCRTVEKTPSGGRIPRRGVRTRDQTRLSSSAFVNVHCSRWKLSRLSGREQIAYCRKPRNHLRAEPWRELAGRASSI